MLNSGRARTQPRIGMDYPDPKRKGNFVAKVALAAILTTVCILVLNRSSFNYATPFSVREPGVTHVLVTGGAGYIGSHATLRLLTDGYRVTIVDNLSRGNKGAVKILQELFPEPGRLQFIYADLGDAKAVNKIFAENAFDAVMHFAAVAYVGESTMYPLNDWGGSVDDGRSTSGYLFSFGSGVFSWRSKKQESVALSTAEAEFLAATAATKQVRWLRKILTDVSQKVEDNTEIYVDNQAAIAIAKNPVFHDRTKHFNIKSFFVRDVQKSGEVKLVHCNTEDQLADLLTKPLPAERFECLRLRIGVCGV